MRFRIFALSNILILSSTGLAQKTEKSSSTELEARIQRLKSENQALEARLKALEQPTLAPASEVTPPLPPENTGFGRVAWGASAKQVQTAYKSSIKKTDSGLLYLDESVAGKSALTLFRFVDDQLVAVLIKFREDYVNKNNFLSDHEEIRELLEQKYGSPKESSRDIWLGDKLYRDKPGEWGMAVATGRLSRWSVWTLPETEIELGTTGESFKIQNKISYTSIRLKPLLEINDNKKSTSGL